MIAHATLALPLLIALVALALAFDFVNGVHDLSLIHI